MFQSRIYRLLFLVFLYIGMCFDSYITTPANWRITTDILDNILKVIFLLVLFQPNRNQTIKSLIFGFFIVFTDFVEESIAFYFNLWRPELGLVFPPFIVIPFEMTFGFIFAGMSMALLLNIPHFVRKSDMNIFGFKYLKLVFRNPQRDFFFVIFMAILLVIGGTLSDWDSVKYGIYVLGPNWTELQLFLVWCLDALISVPFYLVLHNYFATKEEKIQYAVVMNPLKFITHRKSLATSKTSSETRYENSSN